MTHSLDWFRYRLQAPRIFPRYHGLKSCSKYYNYSNPVVESQCNKTKIPKNKSIPKGNFLVEYETLGRLVFWESDRALFIGFYTSSELTKSAAGKLFTFKDLQRHL